MIFINELEVISKSVVDYISSHMARSPRRGEVLFSKYLIPEIQMKIFSQARR